MKRSKPKKLELPPIKKACHHPGKTEHPDHSSAIPRLKRAAGQIQGIQRMIEDGRYCVDLLIQLRAATAAIRTVEGEVFKRHLQNCVREAMSLKDPAQANKKIEELTELLIRRTTL